jgi:hypothetical protein
MTENEKAKTEVGKQEAAPQAEAKPIMVQDILRNYPADREGARDSLLLAISSNLGRIANTLEYNLGRIANTLEYFANVDITNKKASEIQKK